MVNPKIGEFNVIMFSGFLLLIQTFRLGLLPSKVPKGLSGYEGRLV